MIHITKFQVRLSNKEKMYNFYHFTSVVRVESTLRFARVMRATVFSGLARVLDVHTMFTASYQETYSLDFIKMPPKQKGKLGVTVTEMSK